MKSEHWTNFTPSNSKVDSWYGGMEQPMTFSVYSNRMAFTAVTYRLQVNSAHSGWHHYMGMYTSWGGCKFQNAVVKKNCEPGFYQMVLHFNHPYNWAYGGGTDWDVYGGGTWESIDDPVSLVDGTDGWGIANPHTGYYARERAQLGMFYGQDGRHNNYYDYYPYHCGRAVGTEIDDARWTTVGDDSYLAGNLRDIMVMRPTLVNPANCNNWQMLWDANAYDGTQMYYTGFPIALPSAVVGSTYEI